MPKRHGPDPDTAGLGAMGSSPSECDEGRQKDTLSRRSLHELGVTARRLGGSRNPRIPRF
jgi:hypothetical protein